MEKKQEKRKRGKNGTTGCMEKSDGRSKRVLEKEKKELLNVRRGGLKRRDRWM